MTEYIIIIQINDMYINNQHLSSQYNCIRIDDLISHYNYLFSLWDIYSFFGSFQALYFLPVNNTNNNNKNTTTTHTHTQKGAYDEYIM